MNFSKKQKTAGQNSPVLFHSNLIIKEMNLFKPKRTGKYSNGPNVRTINWAKREQKRDNDISLLKYIKEPLSLFSTVNCISLPSHQWIWERMIAAAFPDKTFNFIGVERDRQVNHAGRINAKRLNAVKNRNYTLEMLPPSISWTNAMKGDFSSEIVGEDELFQLLYADYMGTWSPDKIEDYESIFSNDRIFPMFCTCIVTLSLGRNSSPLRRDTLDNWSETFEAAMIEVLDPNYYNRLRNKNPKSIKVLDMAKSIGAQTKSMAWDNHKKMLRMYPTHIYYTPGKFKDLYTSPEGSYCFSRIL